MRLSSLGKLCGTLADPLLGSSSDAEVCKLYMEAVRTMTIKISSRMRMTL